MNRQEKQKMLRDLSEKELTKKFLIPLFEAMGFKNVEYNHGILEKGKDLLLCKEDELGGMKRWGVQVKKGDADAKTANELFTQTSKAYGSKFTDLTDKTEKNIDRFYILISGVFKGSTKDDLLAQFRESKLDRVTEFINGPKLLDLIEEHLPSALFDEYDHFKNYHEAMKEDFEKVKDVSAIGQKEPMPLEDIFVSLKLAEKTGVGEREIPLEPEQKIFHEKIGKKEMERREERARTVDPERALKDFRRMVIVGAPGAGKTTLLRHIALVTCGKNLEKLERECVPIPITLREFSDSRKSLRKYIDAVFEKYNFPKAKDTVEKDLKAGKCRLLLDGFDELAVKEKQSKVADEILGFAKKYPECQIVVTSRTAGYGDELKGFAKLELMEFDDGQIKKFIENWFGKTNPEKAGRMRAAIKNENIKRLARNPLMISIIAIICEEDKPLPQRRAELYGRCVDVLLERWDVKKRIGNNYDPDAKKFLLGKLAYKGHSANRRIFSEKEILEEIKGHSDQLHLKEEDTGPFLDEIWKRSYLLRQIADGMYDFLHLSFQEYFTAAELKKMPDGASAIVGHLDEPWWEEPILLYAGLKTDAAGLVRKIKGVPEDIFHSNLLLSGKCVADAKLTEPDIRDQVVEELWNLYQTSEFKSLRERVLQTLSLIKPDRLIDSLIDDLKSKDEGKRAKSVHVLGSIGSEKAVEPLLERLANDKSEEVRGSVAYALGSIGSEKAVEPLLERLAGDESDFVRESAADALGSIGSEKAVEPLLERFAEDKSDGVRRSAADALCLIGSEKAVEPLLECLAKDKPYVVRRSAAFALGRIGSERAVETLLKCLAGDESDYVRGSAAGALGRIGSERAVETLLKCLAGEKNGYVLASAVGALGRIGSEKAVEPLLERLSGDESDYVRRNAAFALGLIGCETAVEPLKKALKDKGRKKPTGERVKDAVFEALRSISRKTGERIYP